MKNSKSGLRVIGGMGFQTTFQNGVTVSVMFGPANYCAARGPGWRGDVHNHTSNDAEIAVFDRSGWLLSTEDYGDNVVGGVSPEAVAWLMVEAAEHVPGQCFRPAALESFRRVRA